MVLYLEFVFLVLGPFVKWPVIPESPDVIYFVKALDVIGNAVSLQYFLVFWNWRHCIYLQIYT